MPRTTRGWLFFGTILRSPTDCTELTDPRCHSEPKPAGPRESYKNTHVTHSGTRQTAGVENQAFDRSPEMSVPGSRSEGADAPPRAVTEVGDSEETQVYKAPLSPGDQTTH